MVVNSDMALNQGLMMNVNDAFSGKTVFITGGTGFLGKVCEKMYEIKNIFLWVINVN